MATVKVAWVGLALPFREKDNLAFRALNIEASMLRLPRLGRLSGSPTL